MDAADADADAHADRSDAISEPVESETTEQQSLQDYIEASLMLQYNNR